MFKNKVMNKVFETFYNEGFTLQKCKEETFFVILPNNHKREVFDTGSYSIGIGGIYNVYSYENSIDECIEKLITDVKIDSRLKEEYN